MPSSTFADRLAYLRWRWAAGSIKSTDLAFAQSLGVGEKWYAKWKASAKSPSGRDEHKAIAKQLGQPVADWLYDDEGDAPEPNLWARWSLRVAEKPAEPYHGKAPSQEKPKRAAKKKSDRKTG